MDDKTPRQPLARGGVLDLRQSRPQAGPARRPAPPKPKPKPSLEADLEEHAKPVVAEAPAARPSPLETPAAAPVTGAALGDDASLRPRRFWPAFWRFLVLLIVFGIVVTGGLYVYLHYIRH